MGESSLNKGIEKLVLVSIEDAAKEEWIARMERLKDKKMFVEPGV